MKRVLLDHCVPRRTRQALAGCEVATAYQRGWSELKNGALLETAERDAFDVLVTADKNLRYQQRLAHRRIAIVELPTNSLLDLLPHFTAIAGAVNRAQPGDYLELSFAPQPELFSEEKRPTSPRPSPPRRGRILFSAGKYSPFNA